MEAVTQQRHHRSDHGMMPHGYREPATGPVGPVVRGCALPQSRLVRSPAPLRSGFRTQFLNRGRENASLNRGQVALGAWVFSARHGASPKRTGSKTHSVSLTHAEQLGPYRRCDQPYNDTRTTASLQRLAPASVQHSIPLRPHRPTAYPESVDQVPGRSNREAREPRFL
jgi:hypothetical protein